VDPGCTCQGCGRHYRVDFNIPDHLWERIKPEDKEEGAGLLCGVCIATRLEELGAFGVVEPFKRFLAMADRLIKFSPEEKKAIIDEYRAFMQELDNIEIKVVPSTPGIVMPPTLLELADLCPDCETALHMRVGTDGKGHTAIAVYCPSCGYKHPEPWVFRFK
jgi:RNase P subunit RPR2